MTELTKRQRQVLDFVQKSTQDGRPAPTLREIAAHFGFASTRAAADHLNALKCKGALESEPGKARSLRPGSALQSLRRPMVDIPLFGSIPAGYAETRDQEPDGCVSVDIATIGIRPTRNTFALRVSGDSMMGRHICDGDIVILEHGPDPRPGQVVAALIDRKSTLKTFVLKNGKPFRHPRQFLARQIPAHRNTCADTPSRRPT